MSKSKCTVRLALIPTVIGLSLVCHRCVASSGNVHTLPGPMTTPRSGLQIEIDSRWISGNGYRPVRIVVRTMDGTASTQTRNLQVTVMPNPRSNRADSSTMDLTLDANSVSVSGKVLVRQKSAWSRLRVEVRERGSVVRDLSGSFSVTPIGAHSSSESYPSFLFIDSDAPLRANRRKAISNLVMAGRGVPSKLPNLLALRAIPTTMYSGRRVTARIGDAATLQYAETVPRVDLLNFTETPTNWLELTCCDIICLSLSDAERLRATTPRAWSAVVKWTRCGGCLWITGGGRKIERHKEVAQLLGLQPGFLFPYGWQLTPRTRGARSRTVADLNGISPDGRRPGIRRVLRPGRPLKAVPRNRPPRTRQPKTRRSKVRSRSGKIKSSPRSRGSRSRSKGSGAPQPSGERKQSGAGSAAALQLVHFKPAPPPGGGESVKKKESGKKKLKDYVDDSKQAIQQLLQGGVNNVQRATVPRRLGPPVFVRRYNFGTVVLFGSARPFSGTGTDPITALNVTGGRSWMWFTRHGMSMHRENTGFWGMMIDGVGEAPVLAFLILITLFALVIGPINYLGLRNRGRQSLMMVTVPIGAAVVTTLLVCYAAVSDGFGVKVRTRSVVHLDQRTGQSTSWSRQSYYASLAPSRGLIYPDDAAAYHLQFQPKTESSAPVRHIRWSDSEQRLRSGYMSSRDWCQLLVIRDRQTTAGLDIKPNPNAAPTVLNQLGTTIQTLILVAEDGKIYSANSPTKENETVELTEVTLKEAKELLAEFYGKNMTGMNQAAIRHSNRQQRNQRNRRGGRRRYRTVRLDNGAPDPKATTSLLERAIVDALEKFSAKPKTYYAIVDDSTEVPLGTPSTRYDSLELVIGRW